MVIAMQIVLMDNEIFWENKNIYQSNKLMRTIIVLMGSPIEYW